MPLRVLTVDFWNTMVVARTGGERRQQQRLDHLLAVVRAVRPEAAEADVRAAYRAAAERYHAAWTGTHTTPACATLVRCIWEALELDVSDADHAEAVRVFEEGLLYGPPDLADGLAEALAHAAERYRLAIISDTMFSPGRVIRRLLDQRGLLRHFDASVFSDETGVAKPDARAFERAAEALGAAPHEIAHIGDLRRTDVAGARRFGARAVLYTGVRPDPDDAPTPDAVLTHWRDLPQVLDAL